MQMEEVLLFKQFESDTALPGRTTFNITLVDPTVRPDAPSNIPDSSHSTQLYLFEDHAAVFKDAESVRSGQSHVTSQPSFFPPRDPGGMLSRSVRMPSRNDRPPSIWDTHGISGNVFVNPTASSSAPYPQGFNPWFSNVSEHISPRVISSMHEVSVTLRLRALHSIQLPTLLILLQPPALPAALLLPRG